VREILSVRGKQKFGVVATIAEGCDAGFTRGVTGKAVGYRQY
jgi:hypothetical protein